MDVEGETAAMSDNKPEIIHDASDFGTVATHSGQGDPPVLVGPSTADQANTIGLGLPPVACLSLHDLVFETDSSFVMPDAAKVLKNLPALREGHKSKAGKPPLLSIFAHADPSGTDEYNKSLSGRRAKSVYGLLRHDVGIWLSLYNSPMGGDDWRKKGVDDIMRGMLGKSAPVARSDLILAYMKAISPEAMGKADFLGRGASPGGKADYQGCSEFNPLLLLTEEENKAMPKKQWRLLNRCNRRVVILLFSPLIKINPSLWPCPLAGENASGCRKRFFSNAEQRRTSTDQRREFTKTKDTFSCRFYQLFAESSPCERILHYLRIRLFDHFGNPIYNAPYRLEFPSISTTDIAADSYAKIANVEIPASGKVFWSRPYSANDVTTMPPESAKYEYELDVFVDDREDEREECAKRRLNNLGYCADDALEKNIRDFQQDIGRAAPDGSLDDIFSELETRYVNCDPPKRHPV